MSPELQKELTAFQTAVANEARASDNETMSDKRYQEYCVKRWKAHARFVSVLESLEANGTRWQPPP